jgi:prepilin-type N-terminal cleavage/methylation domain-containing protein
MKFVSHAVRFVRGFTLVELIISIAIMVTMTVLLLANYPESAVRITLINSTHKLALLVREAQVRGSAIDSLNSSIGGYGVHASLATPNQIVLFRDVVAGAASAYGLPIGNGLYETTAPSELDSLTTLPNRYIISKLCVGTAYPFTCNAYAGTPNITSLTISFTRPNPQPHIYINGSTATSSSYSGACIELRSPKAPLSGHIRSVEVYSSGMIRSLAVGCDAH